MNNNYQKRKETSAYWFNKSSDLRGAAAAVWVSLDDDVGIIVTERTKLGNAFSMSAAARPVYQMLCGMALELIFKAITVEMGEKVNESTHNLLEHVKPTKIAYCAQETELLRIFSHFITWAGRYPTPKQEKTMDDFNKLVKSNLFESVPFGSHGARTVLQPNGIMNWSSFSHLWGMACSKYFQVRNLEQIVIKQSPENSSSDEAT
ncbi:MAG: hypothetical protein K9N23_14170 [Akkermansiaceae bacterium]|nr:hypothetical protein [Akkermansiaceae bacterium]